MEEQHTFTPHRRYHGCWWDNKVYLILKQFSANSRFSFMWCLPGPVIFLEIILAVTPFGHQHIQIYLSSCADVGVWWGVLSVWKIYHTLHIWTAVLRYASGDDGSDTTRIETVSHSVGIHTVFRYYESGNAPWALTFGWNISHKPSNQTAFLQNGSGDAFSDLISMKTVCHTQYTPGSSYRGVCGCDYRISHCQWILYHTQCIYMVSLQHGVGGDCWDCPYVRNFYHKLYIHTVSHRYESSCVGSYKSYLRKSYHTQYIQMTSLHYEGWDVDSVQIYRINVCYIWDKQRASGRCHLGWVP